MLSFERTLDILIEAAPNRIALYNYAHIPAAFKPYTRVQEADLSTSEASLKLLGLSIRRLSAAGYQYIGMDQFAQADDTLAVAQRRGLLHLELTGFSTHADCDLVGVGVSAIGNVGPTYSQNSRTLKNYYDCLDHNTLPIARGIELTADDLLRRAVIRALICNSSVTKESLSISYLIDFDRYFEAELSDLRQFAELGLVELNDFEIKVMPEGRLQVRNIAKVFDRYLRQDRQRRGYSRVI